MQLTKIEEGNNVIIKGENGAELFRYSTETKEDGTVFSVLGTIKTLVAPHFSEGLLNTLYKANNLIIDFSGASYISSRGLRALLEAQERVDESGNKTMVLRNVCSEIMSVFESTGFDGLLSILR